MRWLGETSREIPAIGANQSVVKLPVSNLGAPSSSPQERRRALQPEEGPGLGDTGTVVIELWDTSESKCLGVAVYPLSDEFFRGEMASSNDDGIPYNAFSAFWIDAFDRTLTTAAVQVKLQVWFESSRRVDRGTVSDTAQRSEMYLPRDDDGKENYAVKHAYHSGGGGGGGGGNGRTNHTLLSRHELDALGPLLCGAEDAEIIFVRKKFFLHALLSSRAEAAKSRDFGLLDRIRRRQEIRVKKEATVVVLERSHPYSLIVVVLDPVTCVTTLQADDIQREVSSFLLPFLSVSCFFLVSLVFGS
jgi:hypothetical protein